VIAIAVIVTTVVTEWSHERGVVDQLESPTRDEESRCVAEGTKTDHRLPGCGPAVESGAHALLEEVRDVSVSAYLRSLDANDASGPATVHISPPHNRERVSRDQGGRAYPLEQDRL
jgi:hypothetical protein